MSIKNHRNRTTSGKLTASPPSRPVPSAFPRSQLTRAELQYWLERAKALPDIRREKVEAVRQAMTENRYDIESRLEDLLDHLPEEWVAAIRNRRSTE